MQGNTKMMLIALLLSSLPIQAQQKQKVLEEDPKLKRTQTNPRSKPESSPNSKPYYPPLITDPLAGTFVLVKGGTFTMGCQDGRDVECYENEKPPHTVTLSSFYMGQTEVTQAQWREVMGNNPSRFGNCDACPVEQVSWEDIQDFLTKLNNLSGGAKFRLPTESEWEYAARGGQLGRGYAYAGSNKLKKVAWYDSNSGGITHAVKGKSANELGLYDMTGNVWEWCSDWYCHYPSASKTDPRGPDSGLDRVFRGGGGWDDNPRECRVAYRDDHTPTNRDIDLGFRLARSF
jgi:formylglycine-generating enzyme required for sulfatase activity